MQDLIIVPKLEGKDSQLTTQSETRKKELLLKSAKFEEPQSHEELKLVVIQSQELKRLMTEAEGAIEQVYRPLKSQADLISKIGKDYLQELLDEFNRLKRLMNAFATKEQARVDEQNAALERERIAAEQREVEALRESERIANLAKPKPKQEIAAQEKLQEAQADVQQTKLAAPVAVKKVAGYSPKKVVKHEITDAVALYKLRPEWFDLVPKKSVMNQSITAKTNLEGLRVWEAVETQTRA